MELYGTSFITIITQFVLDHYYAGLPINLVDERLKDLMRIMDLDILNIFAEVNDSYREYVESFNQPPENNSEIISF